VLKLGIRSTKLSVEAGSVLTGMLGGGGEFL
jgi:hypothetical protein